MNRSLQPRSRRRAAPVLPAAYLMLMAAGAAALGLSEGTLRDRAPAPRIATDLDDYAPGSTAIVTMTGLERGATVAFEVDHVSDPGVDRLWGTPDDVTVQLGGAGHDPWFITDGSALDRDGATDGSIETAWHVNPDDSLDERFLLTGHVIDAGPDGYIGTDDDARTAHLATNTFTDGGGDYSIDFTSAKASLYNKLRPSDFQSYPSGRENEPIVGATSADDSESLAPTTMALGQIVPFEYEITTGTSASFTGTMQFTASWSTATTSGSDFGYDESYGVIAAFVDGSDPNTTDPNSYVSNVVSSYNAATKEIIGTVTVTNLDPNSSTIVEVWLVLEETIAPGTTGNVQSKLVSAKEIGTNQTINTGNQNVPLLRVQEFFTSEADVSIVKSDEPNDINPVVGDDPEGEIRAGDTLTYTLFVKNNSTGTVANDVVVTDTLNSNLAFVSATVDGVGAGKYDAATRTWTYSHGFLERADSATGDWDNNEFTALITVTVNEGTAPSTVLSNTASVATLTEDPILGNNTDSETTVLAANAPPTAVDDVNSTLEDITLVVSAESGLLANDSDPDSQPLTVSQFEAGGTVYAAGSTAVLAEGELTINADGSYSFVPAPDYNGDVPIATYTVTDALGANATATLTLTVTPVIDAELSVEKSVEVYDPSGEGLYAIPGRDVIYTITVTNLGDATDDGSIVIVDPIPDHLTFYRGAFDGATTEPVKFVDGVTPSGLACCTSAHISYSTDGGVTYSYLTPDSYDPAITHLKVVPEGIMGASSTSFEIQFRARIE